MLPNLKEGQFYTRLCPLALLRVRDIGSGPYFDSILNSETLFAPPTGMHQESLVWCPTVLELPIDIDTRTREHIATRSEIEADEHPGFSPGSVFENAGSVFSIIPSTDPNRNFLVATTPMKRCVDPGPLVIFMADDLYFLHRFPAEEVSTTLLSPEEILASVALPPPWVHPATIPETPKSIWEALDDEEDDK